MANQIGGLVEFVWRRRLFGHLGANCRSGSQGRTPRQLRPWEMLRVVPDLQFRLLRRAGALQQWPTLHQIDRLELCI